MAIPTHYAALSSYLGEHITTEEHALQAYEDLLAGRPEDVASYLIGMVLSDEKRHHQIFADMHGSLERALHMREVESALPSTRVTGDVEALLATTSQLLRLEKADLKHLRRLRRKWAKSQGDRKLWALLVKTAEMDTRKHIEVLSFLHRLLGDSAGK